LETIEYFDLDKVAEYTLLLEKVGLLIHLLEAVRSHPFLKGRLALKGVTALNLFIFVRGRTGVAHGERLTIKDVC
jgi:hypothetical protein